MFSPNSCNSAAFLTGVVGLAIVGCAQDDSKRPVAVSSTIQTAAVSGSDSATANTAAPAPVSPLDTPPATPPKRKAKAVPLPKPSIDPGLKPPSSPADSGAAAGAPAAAPAAQDKWLSYDAATNTVTFELIAGPFTFNGYRSGEGTLLLPSKANVVMNFVNKDGTPHSAEVISGQGPIPNAAVDPAIPGRIPTRS